jgi:hypothetical protein
MKFPKKWLLEQASRIRSISRKSKDSARIGECRYASLRNIGRKQGRRRVQSIKQHFAFSNDISTEKPRRTPPRRKLPSAGKVRRKEGAFGRRNAVTSGVLRG